ncbi:MAG: PKD domain-containing protein, partial [Bacteroidetes bacterium]|nr:PKD domain-containing protein [Bacteroidota bacterium]
MKKQPVLYIIIAVAAILFSNSKIKAQCTANFSYQTITCDSLAFTDQSVCSSGYNIMIWNWDFGDGNTSQLQNPTHQYNV